MARRPIKVEKANLKRAKLYGLADIPARTITIDVDAHTSERDLLDTVCHEVLHVAADDMLSESAIEKISADMADVLYRMKWRRIHDK